MTFSSPGVNRGMVVPPGDVNMQIVLHFPARRQAPSAGVAITFEDESCLINELNPFHQVDGVAPCVCLVFWSKRHGRGSFGSGGVCRCLDLRLEP